MTFVIIFVFILCWSPYMIFDLLQVYELIDNNNTTKSVGLFLISCDKYIFKNDCSDKIYTHNFRFLGSFILINLKTTNEKVFNSKLDFLNG